jgi:hypothetical protein
MIFRSLLTPLLATGCALAQLVNGSMAGVVTGTDGSRIPKSKLTNSAEAAGAIRAARTMSITLEFLDRSCNE